MELTVVQLNELVQRLEGTADYLGFAMRELFGTEDLDVKSCEALDEQIFQCETCGWWMEHSEMTENPDKDWNCRDCADVEE